MPEARCKLHLLAQLTHDDRKPADSDPELKLLDNWRVAGGVNNKPKFAGFIAV